MEPTAALDTQARVEQLLRQAHLLRVRQQTGPAEALCRQALELAPEDLQGKEMLADLLADKGELEPALELYGKLFEEQPQKAILEEKIARTVLRKDQDERERIAAQLMLDSPRVAGERKRNTAIAVLLSLLCPGAGQLVNGEYVKGGLLMGFGLLALAFGVPQLIALAQSFAAAGDAAGGGRARVSAYDVNGPLAVLGVLWILIYLYSLLDASSQASKGRKGADV